MVGGEPFWVGLNLRHDAHWHTYWRFPGDAGAPTEIVWELPKGFSAGPIQWPAPKVYLQEDIVNYVYEDEVLLMVRITPPETLSAAQVELRASVSWLECDPSMCVPGGTDLALTLPVAERADPSDDAAQFAAARARWPSENEAWSVHVSRAQDRFQVQLTPRETVPPTEHSYVANGYLFPIDGQTIMAVPPGASLSEATRRRVEGAGRFLQRSVSDDGAVRFDIPVSPYVSADLERFRAVIAPPGGGGSGLRIDVPILTDANNAGGFSRQSPGASPATGDTATMGDIGTVSGAGTSLALPLLLFFGFLGGLILNIMPCVFPVLGLKIMGFVQQAGEAKHKVVQHGLAFTAGVVLFLWILAALLIIFQGTWGQQMQSPTFTLLLAFFFLLFGLNLSGVFEIGTSATGVGGSLMSQGGLKGSFFTGALTVVVATPCSAPFLGSALAGTATMPPLTIFGIFTAIALGLSTPYLLLSLFPNGISRLPRPGPWMETFKQAMAFPIYGAAAFMLYNFAGLVSSSDLPGGDMVLLSALLGLALIALGAWLYGRFGQVGKTAKVRRANTVAALALLLLTPAFIIGKISEQARRAEVQAAIDAGKIEAAEADFLSFQPWSSQAVDEALAAGKPVYIDFTARWCATCQTNKRAYDDPEVIKAYRKAGVVMLRADFTSRNPAIAEAIRGYGANAIPLNVMHTPSTSEPYQFSAWLTPTELLRALRENTSGS